MPIYILINELHYQQSGNFQTNSPIHSINTSNKHHLHRQNANLSSFQKSTFYPGIKTV